MESQLPREGLIRAEPGGIELRETADGKPLLRGHFAVFNEWTEIDSFFEGRFMEQIAPGAFAKTIDENAARMKVLLNHGRDTPLGNTPIGSIRSLEEDTKGAAYEVDLFDGLPTFVTDGLRAGQYGSSFRFTVMRETVEDKPEPSKHNPQGIPERTIQEARVMEFGPVTFPAYDKAEAGLRSLTDDYLMPETMLRRLAGADAPARDGLTTSDLEPSEEEPSPEPEPEPTPEEPEHARRVTPVRSYLDIGRSDPSWKLP